VRLSSSHRVKVPMPTRMDTHDASRPPLPHAAPARPPEPPGRTRLIRTSAVVGLLLGAVYLAWRAGSTLAPDALGLAIWLWSLEVHAWLGLALFTFSLWDVDGAPVPPDVLPDLSVAVFIPTYDEPLEILLPTIAAAVALEPAHTTWVLDDGDRPEVADLARELGASYLTRPEHVGAKAGNLNHALSVVTADLIAVLDADHVAAPGFLLRTLPYFGDDRVALVQTPQDFYNDASFEHVRDEDGTGRVIFSEQAVFYRELQPGKNRWGGAFWCGTGAVVRTAALGSVGGVATTSVTEDIQTTIRLHRRGWRTVYHDEVLARGLAASTADQYALQRRRWCTGAMQVLRQERPLTDRRLSWGQRLTYAATLLGWFDAVRLLSFLLLPLVVLTTGSSPIAAPLGTFVAVFGLTFLAQQHALWRLARGRNRPVPTAIFDLTRLEATLQAIVVGLTGRDVAFRVTPKGASGERARVHVPRLLVVVLIAHLAALGWYGATVLGWTPVTYRIPGVAHGAAFWAVFNGVLVVSAIARIRSSRFAADRRASHRHRLRVPGHLDGRTVDVTDLSLTGAQLELHRGALPIVGDVCRLQVALGDHGANLAAAVRSVRPSATDPDRAVVGLAFAAGQLDAQARLTLGLFNAAAGTGTTPPAPVADGWWATGEEDPVPAGVTG
jgi:cellulose synthase (UDP-forming)